MTRVKMPSNAIVPQQHISGLGWVDCAPHRADRWAVYVKDRLVGRYVKKRDAEHSFDVALARRVADPRLYTLGSRMPARSPKTKTVVKITK